MPTLSNETGVVTFHIQAVVIQASIVTNSKCCRCRSDTLFFLCPKESNTINQSLMSCLMHLRTSPLSLFHYLLFGLDVTEQKINGIIQGLSPRMSCRVKWPVHTSSTWSPEPCNQIAEGGQHAVVACSPFVAVQLLFLTKNENVRNNRIKNNITAN